MDLSHTGNVPGSLDEAGAAIMEAFSLPSFTELLGNRVSGEGAFSVEFLS